MSYCTVSEIGSAANISHVEAAASVIDNLLGYNGLYVPSSSWTLGNEYYLLGNGGRQYDVRFRTIEIERVRFYQSTVLQWEETTGFNYDTFYRRYIVFDKSLVDRIYAGSLELVGIRGNATLTALTPGTDLLPGQSVIRDGEMVLIREEAVSVEGDRLVTAPSILNLAAITIARRLIFLERDQKGNWENQGISRLTTGFHDEILEYR